MRGSGILTAVVLLGAASPAAVSAQDSTIHPPTQTQADARLDSLEAAASTPSTAQSAVMEIAKYGEWWMLTQRDITTPPAHVRYPGVVARLVRIYHHTDDVGARNAIVGWMMYQVERGEAVAFLKEVAQEPPASPPEAPPGVAPAWGESLPLQFGAIYTLRFMGTQGKAALQDLVAHGTVREPAARGYLEQLARHGFRREHG